MYTFTRSNIPETGNILLHYHCSFGHHHCSMIRRRDLNLAMSNAPAGWEMWVEEIDPELKKVLGLK
jgi:hypothetical protein